MDTEGQSRPTWRRTARQAAAIAGATVVEAVQQPVALLLLLTAVLTTLLVPVFQFHRFSEDGRLARDSGLSCMLVFGLVLAAGTAGRSVADEIACGTAAAALGKPVSRVTFLLAKWMGVCGVVTVFWCGVLAATLLAERCSAHFLALDNFTGYATDPLTLLLSLGGAVLALAFAALRHNRRRGRFGVAAFWGVALSQVVVVAASGFYNRFGQFYPVHGEEACLGCVGESHAHGAGGWLLYRPELNLRVLAAAVLVLLALAVFAALATALATRLQTGAALAICALVLLLGLAGDSFALGAHGLSWRGIAAGLMPDMQHFWLCDAIAHGGRIAWSYVAEAGAYALTCCALFLTAGCLAFRERDLG